MANGQGQGGGGLVLLAVMAAYERASLDSGNFLARIPMWDNLLGQVRESAG